MALDVGKIIDGLKLSYGQLRNLLITSIGAIATVWIVGNKVGSITTKMDTFGNTLNEIKTEIVINRTVTEDGLNKIYTDFTTINETNNELWNSKFTLLLEYGDGNKDLLKKLLDYEDKRAAAANQKVESGKEYNIGVEPVKKNPRNGEASITPVDDNGNPIDSLEVKYDSDGNVIKDLSIGARKKNQ